MEDILRPRKFRIFLVRRRFFAINLERQPFGINGSGRLGNDGETMVVLEYAVATVEGVETGHRSPVRDGPSNLWGSCAHWQWHVHCQPVAYVCLQLGR
jgi:hypothetical protein